MWVNMCFAIASADGLSGTGRLSGILPSSIWISSGMPGDRPFSVVAIKTPVVVWTASWYGTFLAKRTKVPFLLTNGAFTPSFSK